jgi:hypothetical protein
VSGKSSRRRCGLRPRSASPWSSISTTPSSTPQVCPANVYAVVSG